MLTGQPFDDIRTVISDLSGPDEQSVTAIRAQANAKPFAEARGLLDLTAWLGAWQGTEQPVLKDIHICLLVSSYSHVAEGPAMAADYVDMAAKGRAPVNLLCVDRGIGLRVIDMAPSVPHALDGRWSDADCVAAIAFGMEAAAAGGDLLGLSDFAPGNEAPAAALIAYCLAGSLEGGNDLLTDEEPVFVAARTMLSSIDLPPNQPLAALRLLGGREIAGMVGAMIAARSAGLPVLTDGWAALGAIAVLEALSKEAAAHVRVAGVADTAQARLMAQMKRTPLIGVPVGVGPGCAVAAGLPVLAAAAALPGVPERRR
ncbi:nicotinate-nucleotide--dimethylbenzimidazole phosphoribosyltransferase [Kordiimonas marina]|uniref:nicotinate-nucleotide--dimethylbenzimidazole phosphoribosyltransferase n=1 Tax=Kordiimonas marina TaxID=2872312 RepID=UPI001FF55786|nr:nicotinate-nucleotide--dimethylbenzimidazole phosphoribosyltransferase [Kordiimonas marina]MCJ9430360.1 nicotinate-nucleotide--dimethylbenzimidazole phosphoribosyltransferase [Kordiimonas marina]